MQLENNRFNLILNAAQRARQIQDQNEYTSEKPILQALKELELTAINQQKISQIDLDKDQEIIAE